MAEQDSAENDDADGERVDDPGDTDPPRVLVDVMCGSLATYLRMCGYDAAYALDRDVEADDQLRQLAEREERLLITRDRELAAQTDGTLLLTEREVLGQQREVSDAGYPVSLAAEPTRCGSCNGSVERIGTEGSSRDENERRPRPDYVPDPGPESPDRFWRCRDCDQWFWKGGHWASVAERLDET